MKCDAKFIYTFSEEEYRQLLKEGFPFLNKMNFGKKEAYVFLNNVSKSVNFSTERKKELFFSNNMFF